MKLTIGSEAIFFICLIVSYLYFWRSGHFQKEVVEHLSIQPAAVFTLFLAGSSFTFMGAERAFRRGNAGRMKTWLTITLLFGIIFLAGQGHEYYKLIREKLTISQSEFGSSFYTLTGFHGLHVLVGLVLLLIVLLLTLHGYFKDRSSSVVSTIGLYWHFVDIVWLFVFTTIYVLPYLV